MALTCSLQLSAQSYSAGATPPPSVMLSCFNPGASDVAVTGASINTRVLGATPGSGVPAQRFTVPCGLGQTVIVPAGGDRKSTRLNSSH